MRYTVNQIRSGDDELILNYKQINAEVEAVLAFMEKHQKVGGGNHYFFASGDFVYRKSR